MSILKTIAHVSVLRHVGGAKNRKVVVKPVLTVRVKDTMSIPEQLKTFLREFFWQILNKYGVVS
jgi:hypothetical protein